LLTVDTLFFFVSETPTVDASKHLNFPSKTIHHVKIICKRSGLSTYYFSDSLDALGSQPPNPDLQNHNLTVNSQ